MTALVSNGALGSYAMTEDLFSAPSTGFRWELRVDANVWQPGTALALAEWFDFTRLYLGPVSPALAWEDSSAVAHTATALAPLPFDDGLHWIAVEVVFDDGSGDHTVEFLWSNSNTDDPGLVAWTSLGVDTIPGTTDLRTDMGWEMRVGGSGFVAGVPAYHTSAGLYVDGSLFADPLFSAEAVGTLTWFDSIAGNTWVIAEGIGAGIVEYPPEVPLVQLAGAVRGAVAAAPRFISDPDVLNPLRVRVLRPDGETVVASLDSTIGDSAREQRNAPGSGTLTLLNDDPAIVDIRKYDIVQHIIEGQVAYSSLVETIAAVDVAPEEEAGERTTYNGRGHLALLELGTVYPSRGAGALPIERDRVWKWTASTYDDSWWPNAVNAGNATGSPRLQGTVQVGYPLNGADVPGNYWAASTGDTDTMAPLGPVYLRSQGASIPGTEPREYMLMWAPDNYGEFYVDSQLIDSVPAGGGAKNFLEARMLPIVLSPGPVQFAARVVNAPLVIDGFEVPPGLGINPVGLWFVLATLNTDGTVADVIATGSDGWKALGRPAQEPGMTPGEVLRITLDEWSARAAAAGHAIPPITRSCTDAVDSAGQPWGVTPNIATKVGNDLLTFYTEVAATYWDMRMRPGSLVLDTWVKNTYLPPSGVTYVDAPADDPRLGNTQSLTRTTA